MRRLIMILLTISVLLTAAAVAISADVRYAWDANDPAPEGYRVFIRYDGDSYDYTQPAWQGSETTSDPIAVQPNRVFFAVVRAYVGPYESANSNEVGHAVVNTPAGVMVTVMPR